jgi:hypothetical protein
MHTLLSCQAQRKKIGAVLGEKLRTEDADYPGGPDVYRDYVSVWYMDFWATAVIMLQLMMNVLSGEHCSRWKHRC